MSRKQLSNKIKQAVKESANFRCEYCQTPENYCPANFSIDHIIPISLGGSDEIENLCAACHGCNWAKSNKTTSTDPETKAIVSLFNPRQDSWQTHFRWYKSNLEIQGLTPIGRTTVNALKLNRPSLINLRYALSAIKKHPPV